MSWRHYRDGGSLAKGRSRGWQRTRASSGVTFHVAERHRAARADADGLASQVCDRVAAAVLAVKLTAE